MMLIIPPLIKHVTYLLSIWISRWQSSHNAAVGVALCIFVHTNQRETERVYHVVFSPWKRARQSFFSLFIFSSLLRQTARHLTLFLPPRSSHVWIETGREQIHFCMPANCKWSYLLVWGHHVQIQNADKIHIKLLYRLNFDLTRGANIIYHIWVKCLRICMCTFSYIVPHYFSIFFLFAYFYPPLWELPENPVCIPQAFYFFFFFHFFFDFQSVLRHQKENKSGEKNTLCFPL